MFVSAYGRSSYADLDGILDRMRAEREVEMASVSTGMTASPVATEEPARTGRGLQQQRQKAVLAK